MEFNLQNMTLGFNKYTVIWYLKIQRKCYIKKSLDFFFNALKYPPSVKQWIFSVSWKKKIFWEKNKNRKANPHCFNGYFRFNI